MGHIITDKGIRVDEDKVKGIKDMPSPKNVKELRSFLGMVTYLSKFVKNLSDLSNLLR